MERRDFLNLVVTGISTSDSTLGQTVPVGAPADVFIERSVSGKPNQGKVFALVTPHLDDGPIFAGGTIVKMLNEGFTGYLIRTSNDEKDSYRRTLGETVLANEQDAELLAKTVGLKQVFDLSYRNHRMDDVARSEIRGRLIFLFRLLHVDTVLSYDPWGHYEENPDHYITAQAVEAACWMAGGSLDFPEHFAAGLRPHSVSEKYYFARGPQLVNRVVDISATLPGKLAAIRSCRTMVDHMVKDLNDTLAAKNLRIPALTGDPSSAGDEFIRAVFQARDHFTGGKYALEYAEEFHYIGPDHSLDEYISRNAVRV
jgi:LmbE family N-acetylglucosaminyl deacetylase